MKNIKIIFFDVDGTLIDIKQKRMTDKMKETLLRLKENNYILALATGRAPITIPDFDGIEFDVYVTFNGSYCYNRQHIIHNKFISQEDVFQILANAKELKRPISVATKDKVVANGSDEDLTQYYSFAKLNLDVIENFDEVLKEDIYQIMLGSEKKEYPILMKNVKNARITAWWERAVDIIPADGGKGLGVEKVLEYYHLDKEEALAFGDGNNDLEMLQTVGCGVAMGNASEELKMIADTVCPSVAEDGIYQYCLSNGLI